MFSHKYDYTCTVLVNMQLYGRERQPVEIKTSLCFFIHDLFLGAVENSLLYLQRYKQGNSCKGTNNTIYSLQSTLTTNKIFQCIHTQLIQGIA